MVSFKFVALCLKIYRASLGYELSLQHFPQDQ
jgi:hypothetical protein